VKKAIDCDVFQDQLDALDEGTLPDESREQLRLHAASCPECAMLLKMHEHTAAPSRAGLEAVVPDDLLASMLPRVRAAIGDRRAVSARDSRRGRGPGWLVPTMVAATIILALGVGFLFTQLRQLQGREQALARQVVEQQRWLAELDSRMSSNAVVRTAALAGRTAWERALARRQNVSVAELGDMLRRVPASTTVLSASQLQSLIMGVPSWARAAWNEALSDVDRGDGIQAGELLQLLQALPVNPERTMPTARILGLLKGGAGGRS
jgi:anti-sigma factor RsiW